MFRRAEFSLKNAIEDLKYLVKHYESDPVGYVKDILKTEPDKWQAEVLKAIVDNRRVAIRSGHGIGKTALSAFVIKWFMSTRPNPQVIVTANTLPQLQSKTWRELAKWNNVALDGKYFQWTATKFYMKLEPETWCAYALGWSEERAEAFAGTHEEHVLMIFDEASAIADVIWDVAEGAMTTIGSRWLVLGNPTRNIGRFRECFRNFAHRWKRFRVDSRNCKFTDKDLLNEWIEDYGEDSDFVRVRVKGEFPRASSSQLISEDAILDAMKRELPPRDYSNNMLIMGIDVARSGDDFTVFSFRQGRKVFKPVKIKERDIMKVASIAAHEILERGVSVCAVDAVGIGAGVFDRLKEMNYCKMIEVQSAAKSEEDVKYSNKRAEMYWNLREFIEREEVDLPKHKLLEEDLIAIEYGYNNKMQIQIESKKDIKKKLGRSPDFSDSLALTFVNEIYKQNFLLLAKRNITTVKWGKAWG